MSPRKNRTIGAMICASAGLMLALVHQGTQPLTARAADTPEDFSGVYAFLQRTVTVAELPVIADVYATTRAVSLQTLEHRDGRLFGAGELCDLTLVSSSSVVQMELPEAFRRSLPPVRVDAELTFKDGKLEFRQAPQTLVVGARLEPGAPLPTSAKDKRVVDQDRDGRPGVTVRVSGLVSGDIYVVQRTTSRLTGGQRGKALRGRIDSRVEQRILGTTNSLIGDGPATKPVPELSYFRLERLPVGAGCTQARQLAAKWP